jgi:RNA polymerase sigma-70 factor (ECF subfamily)
MDEKQLEQALSSITTAWTLLRRAHGDSSGSAAAAWQELMQRYCGAVYRFLLRTLRDPAIAEELTQEFALRFIRGSFRSAEPGHGRFRDFVKTSLFHLVHDYCRRQGKEPAAADATAELDFRDSWRQELLARAWKAQAVADQESGQPFYAVLRFRVEHPDMPLPKVAEVLGARLGQSLSASTVRQLLDRAREQFAEFLMEETRHSLGTAGVDLEDELAELNLLKYCKDKLKKTD